jgi:colanic acid biosynthesis glycosyl transferase WcaI
MRLLVHDYGGYSFSIQLSRELARRGHCVSHFYGDSTQAVKRGFLQAQPDDPPGFFSTGLTLSHPFCKYSLLKRRAQECEYGRKLARAIRRLQPQVVISANTPLDAQAAALRSSHQVRASFVFWLQDAVGLATFKILTGKSLLLGQTVGRYYLWLERTLLQHSQAAVLISEDFLPLVEAWGVRREKLSVAHNWAPLDEISPLPKANPWAERQGLADKFTFLFSGVLGMKHNPGLLLDLARHWQRAPLVRVVVVSEGPAAEWLKEKGHEQGLDALQVLDFQPYQQFPGVLASADVLVAVLDLEAGLYSVPSKVLSYMCARRPLLLAVPPQNHAARIVSRSGAGLVASPSDARGFLQASQTLYDDGGLRLRMADKALSYARRNFNISSIADQFEELFQSTLEAAPFKSRLFAYSK